MSTLLLKNGHIISMNPTAGCLTLSSPLIPEQDTEPLELGITRPEVYPNPNLVLVTAP